MKERKPVLKLKMVNYCPTEYQECKAFWGYLKRMGFADNAIKHANERREKDSWFIRALYAIGFKKGLLDYQYIVSNNRYHTLWIEMKRQDQAMKDKMPEQDEWIARLLKNGHYAIYAYGAVHAIDIFTSYIHNKL